MSAVRDSTSSARFQAMGTAVEVHGVGMNDDALHAAGAAIDALEHRWSRFIASSEVCRMNERAGSPTIVSDETFELVSLAVEGWRLTGGLFDPTLLDVLIQAGYDRSYELLDHGTETVTVDVRDHSLPSGRRRSAVDGIVLEPILPAVTLPAGTAFDPGGIGKGLAADIVVDSMLRAGAAGACVNIGGDLRCEGVPPDGEAWVVAVEDPFGGAPLGSVVVPNGGIATSSRTKRVWLKDGRPRHHVIDPASGRPSSKAVAATVVASDAWLAEVLAKALLLANAEDAFDLLAAHDCTGLVVGNNGVPRLAPGMKDLFA